MQTRTHFANQTPLPSSISEDAVLRTLHDHAAMIKQNPLVIHYERCDPPANASSEDLHGIWYELTDRVAYLPWGLLHGTVKYRGCFHDTPRGLRTHIYAPMGVHIRNLWTVHRQAARGSEEGEETGPARDSGELALHEEIELACPLGMTTFIRRTLSQAHRELVRRLSTAGSVGRA
ncbi:hypothetical protein N7539_008417 [Penicillium diatomitis]|uniref:DUF7053 domain-containing protein n=1 Tax=Penicillium diatomitis TaxID=2819901 RepID=A0A9W9WU37_9EURO|nr:uncharacterized protein N7539_008417 [Penicillium diatomitis]KAJ5475351.1 hypothetical protein N7539_008417 [Penicillium diatomitis]